MDKRYIIDQISYSIWMLEGGMRATNLMGHEVLKTTQQAHKTLSELKQELEKELK